MSKTKSLDKSNYYLNRHDMHVMSVSMKCGYKIYPDFHPQQAWVRYDPLVILCGTYKGRLYRLIDKPFDQRYLTYYIMVFYHKFYNKHILNKEVVEPIEVKAPPPPKEPIVETKQMFAPPPPPNTE